MGNTIYASFGDSANAEKAAGALLDHGVRAEDISVIRGTNDIQNISETYEGTSPIPVNEQAWTGENRNVEANRIGYSGAAYDSLSAAPTTEPSARELAYENTNYGNTATRTEFAREELEGDNVPSNEYTGYRSDVDTTNIEYPATREIENRDAMTSAAYGRDVNDTSREDRNPDGDIERAAKGGISTTTGADAGAGAVKGAGWGAGLGILAAIASLAVPGFGLVLGGGALAAAIGAAVATTGAGAVAGAVTGYLKDQGMEEHVAASYEKDIRNGGAMIAVTFPSGNVSESEIREVLQKYGAGSVNQSARGYVA